METEATELIQGLCRKDRQAQQRMLLMYGDMVWSQVARIVGCQEDAEEVYQDVFVKAFRNISSYDESRASLSTWLSRIAYNESLNFARRKQLFIVHVDDCAEEVENTSDEELDQAFQQQDEQAVRALEQALEHLPPDDLGLVMMRYFENMAIKDIAYVTDKHPSTIASRLSWIRKKLYKLIKSTRQ